MWIAASTTFLSLLSAACFRASSLSSQRQQFTSAFRFPTTEWLNHTMLSEWKITFDILVLLYRKRAFAVVVIITSLTDTYLSCDSLNVTFSAFPLCENWWSELGRKCGESVSETRRSRGRVLANCTVLGNTGCFFLPGMEWVNYGNSVCEHKFQVRKMFYPFIRTLDGSRKGVHMDLVCVAYMMITWALTTQLAELCLKGVN